eukprot:750354-Hanusia_phi.AAC.2
MVEQMIEEKKRRLIEAESKLATLLPYFRILCRSKELGKGVEEQEQEGEREGKGEEGEGDGEEVSVTGAAGLEDEQEVQQRGFSELFEIEQGGAPKCCICLNGCDYSKRPTFMRCAHFACEECLIHWLSWRSSHEDRAASLSALTAPCPLCRKTFSISNLIKIVPPSDEPAGRDEVEAEEGKRRKRTEAADVITWTPAADSRGVRALPPPPLLLERAAMPGIANFPSLDSSFGSHLHLFCQLPLGARSCVCPASCKRSSRMERLVADVSRCVREEEKVVVFSQYHAAIAHASLVLEEEGIRFVRLAAGEKPSASEEAVRTFNEDPLVSVFLLNAGQLAAGLTLSVASRVILLEPFTNPSEEAQAMNRCHRIGQTKEVSCSIYYAPRSHLPLSSPPSLPPSFLPCGSLDPPPPPLPLLLLPPSLLPCFPPSCSSPSPLPSPRLDSAPARSRRGFCTQGKSEQQHQQEAGDRREKKEEEKRGEEQEEEEVTVVVWGEVNFQSGCGFCES